MLGRACLTVVTVTFVLLAKSLSAGELECTIYCRLDGLTSITWKSTDCIKPSPPMMFYGRSVREYNQSVNEFNYWLTQVDSYLLCVRSEAADDMRKMPSVFTEGVEKARREISDEVRRQRSNLELMRP